MTETDTIIDGFSEPELLLWWTLFGDVPSKRAGRRLLDLVPAACAERYPQKSEPRYPVTPGTTASGAVPYTTAGIERRRQNDDRRLKWAAERRERMRRRRELRTAA